MSKRVLVTAGAGGIGLAIVEAFLAASHAVHVCDVDAASVETLRVSHAVSATVADLSDPAQVASMAREAMAALGGIDAIVNNLGIGAERGPVESISDDGWDAALRTNVSSMFYVVRAFVPAMKAQRSGAIVNISTTSVKTGLPDRTPYVVSKAAVEGLSVNLARELGPFNIRCNTVRPGSIENERGRMLLAQKAERLGISYEQALDQRLAFISMRSRIDPAEIGDMAVFLASDAARHITGQCISVCGNVEWEG